MVISPAEAASALKDIDETTARTCESRGYRYASPHLILWGALWVIGYGLMGVLPREQWGWIWLPVDLVGIAGSLYFAGQAKRATPVEAAAQGPGRLPMFVVMVFAALFVVAVYSVFAPTSAEPYLMFPALLLGLVYVIAGAWKFPRLAWIGAAVFVLTLAGYLLFKPWLAFWIAAVGGGGLMLGGLWLQRV